MVLGVTLTLCSGFLSLNYVDVCIWSSRFRSGKCPRQSLISNGGRKSDIEASHHGHKSFSIHLYCNSSVSCLYAAIPERSDRRSISMEAISRT